MDTGLTFFRFCHLIPLTISINSCSFLNTLLLCTKERHVVTTDPLNQAPWDQLWMCACHRSTMLSRMCYTYWLTLATVCWIQSHHPVTQLTLSLCNVTKIDFDQLSRCRQRFHCFILRVTNMQQHSCWRMRYVSAITYRYRPCCSG